MSVARALRSLAGATRANGRPSRRAHTTAHLYYQSDRVPRSLTSSGLVGTHRDALGTDAEFFGVDPVPTEVRIADGRGESLTLDANGFCLATDSRLAEHIDYYDNDAILNRYYASCEALVQAHTGAERVIAFDHNVRSRAKRADGRLSGAGASAVQEPLTTYGVHNDYTVSSAPRRIEQLSAATLGVNDTLRARADAPPPIDASAIDAHLSGRWRFVNVWRNISAAPVERSPLAMCDAGPHMVHSHTGHLPLGALLIPRTMCGTGATR